MAKIFYNSHADADMYQQIRAVVPRGMELVTLERDDDAERRSRIADAEVVIVAARRLSGDVIRAARRLRLVHHQGVGYQDTIDLDALRDSGAMLATTPEGTTTSVAEHTVMLMLAALRRLTFADAELRLGRWHINSLRTVSHEIADKRIGYVGMGRIGQAVATRLRSFGVTGCYFDPIALSDADERRLGIVSAPLEEVLTTTDIVTLHVPLTPGTRGLVSAAIIARMKPGVVIVNTARGGLIDELALHAGLRSGHVGAAGLDVFGEEPPSAAHPLLRLPNTVLTPHISAGTIDALRSKMRALFANVERFYRGEPLANAVPGFGRAPAAAPL